MITRDVPQRPAFDPGQPGTVTAVQTAPVDLIFGGTGKVVSILTDDEAAGIASGTDIQRSVVDNVVSGSDPALNSQFGSAPGQVSASGFGGGLGGTITNAIGTATSAIGKALSPLSTVGKP